jgi:ABC-type multidrug transport system ATPase subunit
VLASGRAVQLRPRFVTQNDVIHPHITVCKTLAFYGMLRLPASAPNSAKLACFRSSQCFFFSSANSFSFH